ncbi:hypothetical protein BDV96DRAFT_403674 [Lophiotrema nucula]|uniref:Uncharacterized protein n=1 Tax=Lophiotrema nucula TaxID=690887 RepID=A0A6A5ZF01_9PLEO|nr:hypothetical protein BDV96DRAFT_403674 [Lophiotrema nucula]
MWVAVLVVIIVIAASIGGGIGGSVATQRAKSRSAAHSASLVATATITISVPQAQTSTSPTTTIPASSSSSPPSIAPYVPSSPVDVERIDNSCPSTSVSSAAPFKYIYNCTEFSNIGAADLSGLVAYTGKRIWGTVSSCSHCVEPERKVSGLWRKLLAEGEYCTVSISSAGYCAGLTMSLKGRKITINDT